MKYIDEKSDYIGIPAEVRVFTINQPKFKIYGKICLDYNLRIRSQKEIEYAKPDMKVYDEGVKTKVGNSNRSYSSLFMGFGFCFGNGKTPRLNVEFLFPGGIISQNFSSVVVPELAYGLQMTIQIPL
jgi:hypothetical protein